MNSMQIKLSRRSFLGGTGAMVAALVTPMRSYALTESQATSLVNNAVSEITSIINSGGSANSMIPKFERVFARYGDVPTISRFVLGPVARGASNSELSAFSRAFQGYMARKYGSQFQSFIGGKVEVTGARPVNSFVEVKARASARGQSPFDVAFMVSDRSGSPKFFDLVIEGVSLLRTEQTEIGAMLEARGDSIPQVTQALRSAS